MHKLAVFVGILLFAFVSVAIGDSFRCGNKIVSTGDLKMKFSVNVGRQKIQKWFRMTQKAPYPSLHLRARPFQQAQRKWKSYITIAEMEGLFGC